MKKFLSLIILAIVVVFPLAPSSYAVAFKGTSYTPTVKWKNTDGTINWAGYETDMRDMQNAGINWVRVALSDVVSSNGTPNATHLNLLDTYEIQPLMLTWAPDSGGKDYLPTVNHTTYLNRITGQVRAMKQRYPTRTMYYEIHNEENLSNFWNIDGTPTSDQTVYEASVQRYIAMLKDTYTAIKTGDQTALVMNGGLSEYRSERWMDTFIKYEGYKYIDIFAYHPYNKTPTRVIGRLKAMTDKMATIPEFAAKPIWITEVGFHTNPNGNSGMYVVDEQTKADYLVQTMNLLKEYPQVQTPIFWYDLVENGPAFPGYGLYTKLNTAPYTGTYLPAYAAYRNLWNNPSPTQTPTPTTLPTATFYYVDCTNGIDTNNGTSPTTAWQTLGKANSAPLKPGDKLLLKKGCTFTSRLEAAWNGTEASPITISDYGTDPNKPLIQTVANGLANIRITGSYQIIENIRTTMVLDQPARDYEDLCTDIDGQKTQSADADGWWVGFSISGHHNTLQNNEAFGTKPNGLSLGINIADTSHDNKVFNNHIHDLHALWRIFQPGFPGTSITGGMMGAIGVLLEGNDNEVGYNLFEKNGAWCTYTDTSSATPQIVTKGYSAPFEVFNANRSYVHHNKAYGHRKHFEMGHSQDDPTTTTVNEGKTADDNVLAYNLFVSDFPEAKGPNIHGGDEFGPVNRTQIYNNTIVFTGEGSSALTCGCIGGATVRNNIFIGESKAAFFGGTVTESNNIYWDYQHSADTQKPNPFVQFFTGAINITTNAASIAPTSLKTNPFLIDPLNTNPINGNYRLSSTSPAKDKGVILTYTKDLDDAIVPQGTAVDIGAYEFSTVAPTRTPLSGDGNQDCSVTIVDLSALLAFFGKSNMTNDVNGDGIINLTDLSALLSNFGKTCT